MPLPSPPPALPPRGGWVVVARPSILEKESALAGLWTASVSRLILAAAARAKSGRAGGRLLSVKAMPLVPAEEELARRLPVLLALLLLPPVPAPLPLDGLEVLEKLALRLPKEDLRSLVSTAVADCWEAAASEDCDCDCNCDCGCCSPDEVPGRERDSLLLLLLPPPPKKADERWCGGPRDPMDEDRSPRSGVRSPFGSLGVCGAGGFDGGMDAVVVCRRREGSAAECSSSYE